MKKRLVFLTGYSYKYLFRPLLFLTDSESIHNFFIRFGQALGNEYSGGIFKFFFCHPQKELEQQLFGINFRNPVGLAAGFDYGASLMWVLPGLNFGFETIGTITNMPYEGNPKPRLGRLVKTRSLMVNKGFKNEGIKKIVEKLKGQNFVFPVGISIGKTNSAKLRTQGAAVEDIVSAFEVVEKEKLDIGFYELNISCPNLYGKIEFYEPEHLSGLLQAVFALKPSKPVFIKMPISKDNEEIIKMMDVIVKYPVKAVILGNLQKDRNNSSFVREELEKFPAGSFSGLPTRARSNELIKLIYKRYGQKIKIIGCGGIFCGKDAYDKIRAGASLVQLITGLIFEGPQLASQINYELEDLLKKDGFDNITQAIGANVN